MLQLLGTLAGGLMANRSAKKAARGQRQAADLAYERSLPWQTTGMFGGASFDPESREATFDLSPEMQAEYERYMGRAGGTSEALAALEADPMAAASQYAEQMKGLYRPQQEADRLRLENRLLAQGMLGSTGGGARTQALLGAQQQKDLQTEAASVQQAQQMIDLLRGRESSDFGQAIGIGNMPMQYGQYGQGLGSGMSSVALGAAGMQSQAGVGLAGAQAAQMAGLQKSLGGYKLNENAWGNLLKGDFGNLMQAKTATVDPNLAATLSFLKK